MLTNILTGVMLILGLSACTSSPTNPDPQPQRPGTQPEQQREQPIVGQNGPGDNAASGTQTPDGTSTLPITLTRQQIANYIDPVNLSYNVEYLTFRQRAPITFDAAGVASINVPGLPSNLKGTLTFEVLQAGTVKLRAVQNDLTLTPGRQTLRLVLKSVDSQVADLTIEATVENGGLGTGGSIGNNGGSGTTGTTDNPNNTGNTGNTNTGNTGNTNTGNTGGTGNGPSYARDVKPILEAHCTECHHTGSRAPDLSKAPSAQAIASAITRAGAGGNMPPPPRDRLTTAELDKLKAWKDGGMNP